MEVVVIGEKNTITGFSLAGVKRTYLPDDGKENLKSILAEDGLGVLILTERFAEDNREAIEDHQSSKRVTPIIVEVPDVTGPIERAVDPIRELIRRAIGADVSN
jgi:V/A-type H+-transporting ATPase subunit F